MTDALSRNALPDKDDSVEIPWTVLAPIEAISLAEVTLSGRQFVDPDIGNIIRFLEEGALPENVGKLHYVRS